MEVKFKNFHNRHIMLELPTIKTDFLFKNSQDFNQTTHARPLQGLSIPFAYIGSGDPVRVLRLYTMNTLDPL